MSAYVTALSPENLLMLKRGTIAEKCVMAWNATRTGWIFCGVKWALL